MFIAHLKCERHRLVTHTHCRTYEMVGERIQVNGSAFVTVVTCRFGEICHIIYIKFTMHHWYH